RIAVHVADVPLVHPLERPVRTWTLRQQGRHALVDTRSGRILRSRPEAPLGAPIKRPCRLCRRGRLTQPLGARKHPNWLTRRVKAIWAEKAARRAAEGAGARSPAGLRPPMRPPDSPCPPRSESSASRSASSASRPPPRFPTRRVRAPRTTRLQPQRRPEL